MFHKIFYGLCPISLPYYVKIVEEADLAEYRLRTNIKPPDYLGAPVQSSLEAMRAESKPDYLSVKITVDDRVQVFLNSFFIRSSIKWNRLPLHLREISCPDEFKIGLTVHLWETMNVSEVFLDVEDMEEFGDLDGIT